MSAGVGACAVIAMGALAAGVQRDQRGPTGTGSSRPGDDIGDDDRRKRYRDSATDGAADVSRRATDHYAAVDDDDSSPWWHRRRYTEMELPEMNSKKLRLASAAVGASAFVAMGALTVALSDDSDTGTIVSDPEMTLGETHHEPNAPAELETTLAVPEVTAEPPDGFGP